VKNIAAMFFALLCISMPSHAESQNITGADVCFPDYVIVQVVFTLVQQTEKIKNLEAGYEKIYADLQDERAQKEKILAELNEFRAQQKQ